MEAREERIEEQQLRTMSTVELMRHAVAEAKLLARAEVLHAKHELKDELVAARTSGILLGGGAVLGLCGLALLFEVIALALPLPYWLGTLIVGVALVILAGGLGLFGFRGLPKKPLPRTQERLKLDVTLTREELQ